MDSIAEQTPTPTLITWDLGEPNDDRIGSVADSGSAILKEFARFGPELRVTLSGIDHVHRQVLHRIINRGQDRGLRLWLQPDDPRTVDRTVLRAFVSAGLAGITVSLDGPDRKSHDTLQDGVGQFDAAVRIARWAGEFGLPLEIVTHVAQSTLDGIEHLAAKIFALDADRWTLWFTVPSSDEETLAAVHPDEARELLEWLIDIDASSPLSIVTIQAPMYQRFIATYHEAGNPPASGTSPVAGDSLLHVAADGTVRPAPSMEIELGTLPEDNLRELFLRHPVLRDIRDRSTRTGMCGVCEFSDLCGGSRARAFAHFGDPLAQDPLCPYIPPALEAGQPSDENEGIPVTPE